MCGVGGASPLHTAELMGGCFLRSHADMCVKAELIIVDGHALLALITTALCVAASASHDENCVMLYVICYVICCCKMLYVMLYVQL